jgi:hypothetical protein
MKNIPSRKKPRKPLTQSAGQDHRLDTAKSMPLNFKVPAEFRREFKTYAAQHNMKLNQLLFESFAALKARHAD